MWWDFVGNLLLFAAVNHFANRSRIDKVIAMVRVAPFLTHGVEVTLSVCQILCASGRVALAIYWQVFLQNIQIT